MRRVGEGEKGGEEGGEEEGVRRVGENEGGRGGEKGVRKEGGGESHTLAPAYIALAF